MHEGLFQIKEGTKFERLTEDQDVNITVWGSVWSDIIHVTGTITDDVLNQLTANIKVSKCESTDDELFIASKNRLMNYETNRLAEVLSDSGSVLIWPIYYDNGTKYCRIFSVSLSSISDFYQELSDNCEVNLEHKRVTDSFPEKTQITENHLLSELSPRQQEIITFAYQNGYYEIPKSETTASLASELDISRRTFNEHLNKAEQKIISEVMNMIFINEPETK